MMVWRWWNFWPATTATGVWCSSATRSEPCSASASPLSPQHLAAYVGAAQVVNWALQEERSFDWALQEARRTGNRKAQAALDQIGRPVAGQYATGTDGVIQRRWLGTLGGVAADPRFVPRWALSVFTSRGYPLTAKLRYLKAMDRSMDLFGPTCARKSTSAVRCWPSRCPSTSSPAGRTGSPTWHRSSNGSGAQSPAKRLDIVDGVGHLNLYEKPDRFTPSWTRCARALPDTHPGLLAARHDSPNDQQSAQQRGGAWCKQRASVVSCHRDRHPP